MAQPPASPPALPRIGVLMTKAALGPLGVFAALKEGLRDLGYEDGKNVTIEARFGDVQGEQLSALAVELAQLPVDVLVASTSCATQAALDATRSIPIVMVAAGDPVGNKFVTSLEHPGGNVTGIAALPPEAHREQLQTLKRTFPYVSHVGLVWSPARAAQGPKVRELELQARAAGLQATSIPLSPPDPVSPSDPVSPPDYVTAALTTAVNNGTDSLLVFGSPDLMVLRPQILAFVEQHNLPAIYAVTEWVDAGGVLSHGMRLADSFRRAAVYVDRILKGANPGDLAVEVPGQRCAFDPGNEPKVLTQLNQTTAHSQGFDIPQSVRDQCDKIIGE